MVPAIDALITHAFLEDSAVCRIIGTTDILEVAKLTILLDFNVRAGAGNIQNDISKIGNPLYPRFPDIS